MSEWEMDELSQTYEFPQSRPELFDANVPLDERIGRLEGVVLVMKELVRDHQHALIELGIRLRAIEEARGGRVR